MKQHTPKQTKKNKQKLIIIILLTILSLIIIPKTYNLLNLSYQSYYTICNSKTIDEAKQLSLQNGYKIAGYYDPTTKKININQKIKQPKIIKKITKHEQCHQKQHQQNRYPTCTKPLQYILLEAECYTKENLPP